jgi:hypothetical protein
MNLHVTDLTPTQRECIERSQNFRASIAARAAELEHRKMNAALEALCVVAREAPLTHSPSIQTIAPEAMPAETDPPSPNWFVVLASEPRRSDYPSIRDIQKAVCKHYDVTLIDMLSRRRTAIIVKPRQVAMFLGKKLTLHSLPQIGRRFGGRDHTTVLHAVRVTPLRARADAVLAHDIAILTQTITGIPQ